VPDKKGQKNKEKGADLLIFAFCLLPFDLLPVFSLYGCKFIKKNFHISIQLRCL
jgi:hypothetical protein